MSHCGSSHMHPTDARTVRCKSMNSSISRQCFFQLLAATQEKGINRDKSSLKDRATSHQAAPTLSATCSTLQHFAAEPCTCGAPLRSSAADPAQPQTLQGSCTPQRSHSSVLPAPAPGDASEVGAPKRSAAARGCGQSGPFCALQGGASAALEPRSKSEHHPKRGSFAVASALQGDKTCSRACRNLQPCRRNQHKAPLPAAAACTCCAWLRSKRVPVRCRKARRGVQAKHGSMASFALLVVHCGISLAGRRAIRRVGVFVLVAEIGVQLAIRRVRVGGVVAPVCRRRGVSRGGDAGEWRWW